jgi:hypothetical protein
VLRHPDRGEDHRAADDVARDRPLPEHGPRGEDADGRDGVHRHREARRGQTRQHVREEQVRDPAADADVDHGRHGRRMQVGLHDLAADGVDRDQRQRQDRRADRRHDRDGTRVEPARLTADGDGVSGEEDDREEQERDGPPGARDARGEEARDDRDAREPEREAGERRRGGPFVGDEHGGDRDADRLETEDERTERGAPGVDPRKHRHGLAAEPDGADQEQPPPHPRLERRQASGDGDEGGGGEREPHPGDRADAEPLRGELDGRERAPEEDERDDELGGCSQVAGRFGRYLTRCHVSTPRMPCACSSRA